MIVFVTGLAELSGLKSNCYLWCFVKTQSMGEQDWQNYQD